MTNTTILMDGATIHKSKDLLMKLNENGIRRIINVPYSPQFNPIEYTFNTLKRRIKNSNITTFKQLEKTIQKHNKINNTLGMKNYFNHTYNNLKSVRYIILFIGDLFI